MSIPTVDTHADERCAPTCTNVPSSADGCVTRPMREALAPQGGAFTDRDVVPVAQMVRRNLREVFYDLAWRDAEMQDTQQLIDVTSQFRTVATPNTEVPDRLPRAALRVEIALSQAKIELIWAQSRRQVAQAAFNAVLNRAPDVPVTVIGDLTEPIRLPQLNPAISLAKATDVELRDLRREVETQRRSQIPSRRAKPSTPVLPGTRGAARRRAAGSDDAASFGHPQGVALRSPSSTQPVRHASVSSKSACVRRSRGSTTAGAQSRAWKKSSYRPPWRF